MGRNLMSGERRHEVIETGRARRWREQLRRPELRAQLGGPAPGRAAQDRQARRPSLHLAGDRAGRAGREGGVSEGRGARSGEPLRQLERGASNGNGAGIDESVVREARERVARATAPPAAGAASALGTLTKLATAAASGVAKRVANVPKADLDERDPDYIRETLPGPLDARQPLLPRRGARPAQHPRRGPGAAGGQPLGRQPDPRHARLHAGLQHLLRRRAALLPARPQPGAVDARAWLACASTARSPPTTRTPHQALETGAALLVYPGRRLRGAPAELGRRRRSTSTAARASSGWRSTRTCRSCRWSRSAGRRPRCSSRAASGWPSCCGLDSCLPPEGAADLAGAALGPERGRHARPLPAAGQDHDRRCCEPIDLREQFGPRPRRRRDLRRGHHAHAGHPRPPFRRSAACRSSADADRAAAATSTPPREEVWELVSDPANWPRLMHGITRFEAQGTSGAGATGASARATSCACTSARPTSAAWSRSSSSTRPSDLAWTSVTGIDQRGRWRLREADDGGTKVTLRLQLRRARRPPWRARRPLVRTHGRSESRADLAESQAVSSRGTEEMNDEGLSLPGRVIYTLGSVKILAERGRRAPDAAGPAGAHGPDARPLRAQPGRGLRSRWPQRFPDEPMRHRRARHAHLRASVDERTNALAHALADDGIVEGDGVAIMARNHRGFIEATVALSKLGADSLYLNTAFAGPQLTEVVKREKPRAIIYDEEFGELLEDAGTRRKRFVAWHDSDDDRRPDARRADRGGRRRRAPVPPEREGRAVILTSGTTGTPKGASRGQPAVAGPGGVAALEDPAEGRARSRTSRRRCSTPGASRTSRSGCCWARPSCCGASSTPRPAWRRSPATAATRWWWCR